MTPQEKAERTTYERAIQEKAEQAAYERAIQEGKNFGEAADYAKQYSEELLDFIKEKP